MNEQRVIALGGLFQALALLRSLAMQGQCDTTAFETSIASIFKLDADSAADVYGGVGGVSLGLKTLIVQIGDENRDFAVTRLTVAVLRLERRLARRRATLDTLREGIVAIARQVEHLGTTHSTVLGRLGELYASTLSLLRPRVVVQGNPLYLSQPAQVERIRAVLLAAVRAAVLWRQLGGSHWGLIFNRKQNAMLARGLLARSVMDAG
jgi:high frequency lysogenization protein